MDSGGKVGNLCNGNKVNSNPYSLTATEQEQEEEEDDGEMDLLLGPKQPPAPAPAIGTGKGRRGGLARKKKDRERGRSVQWNDCNGNDLVEILEFQPSDTSDSEDEYADSCICTIM